MGHLVLLRLFMRLYLQINGHYLVYIFPAEDDLAVDAGNISYDVNARSHPAGVLIAHPHVYPSNCNILRNRTRKCRAKRDRAGLETPC